MAAVNWIDGIFLSTGTRLSFLRIWDIGTRITHPPQQLSIDKDVVAEVRAA